MPNIVGIGDSYRVRAYQEISMLNNFTSVITSIRKETERLRDNILNNTNSPGTNLSSIFQQTSLLLGGKVNTGSNRVDTALLRKRLESGFPFDLTVDTRRPGNNLVIRENYDYFDAKFESPVKTLVPKKLNSTRNKVDSERFTNFRIKTLNNLQDANSDLSLAEELLLAELRDGEVARNNENNVKIGLSSENVITHAYLVSSSGGYLRPVRIGMKFGVG